MYWHLVYLVAFASIRDRPDQLRGSDEFELLNQSAKNHALGPGNSLLRIRTNIYRKKGNSGRVKL